MPIQPDEAPTALLTERGVTLEQLRAFVLIGQPGGGFQRAAQALGRSQSALTQSLRRLESQLGCRLVERRRGHVAGLTAPGQRLLPAAREILGRTAEALSAVRQPPLSGRLRVGVPDDFGLAELQGVIARFAGFNPALRIEVVAALSAQLVERLQAGELDLALLRCIGSEPAALAAATRQRPLRREPLHWVGRERRPFTALAELPLVLLAAPCSYRQLAIDALARAGKPWYPAYSSSSYANLRSAIGAGLGIGVLPARAIGAPLLALGAAEGFPPLATVTLLLVEASDRPPARQLGQFLRAAVGVGAGNSPRAPDHC